ncbi:MAG TPA: molecular chaperone DnaJ [Rhodobacteraceae bacterium]|nr:molecular chaperone DnaJ [Paracoccaceae bacterium]
MKLNSKYFDSIRIKRGRYRVTQGTPRSCEWPGCTESAPHKAPKGRDMEGQFHYFCLEHVRQYNKSYNYFDGMKDDDVIGYQRDAVTGHRPTWKMGTIHNGPASSAHRYSPRDYMAARAREQARAARPRHVRTLERKSLATLGLDETANAAQIKARYKWLVKRHHPDANGGSRENEEHLRAIIEAYRHLKSVKMC